MAILAVELWPLFLGRQMGQSHTLWTSHPWMAGAPGDLPTRPLGDPALQFHPLLTLARDALGDGHLPLWNPHSYGGMVLFGDLQVALAHPITWLALVLGVEDAWGPMTALKLLTGGAGAYLFAARLGTSRGGALVAGAVYMLCAPNVLWAQWPVTAVLSMFPWLLWATHALAERPGRRPLAALALVVGVSLLAGHPESVLLSSSAAGVYLLVLLWRSSAAGRERVRALLAFGGGHLLGLAVAAIALLPFLEALGDSVALEVHGEGSGDHLPLSHAILLAVPHYFGDGRPVFTGHFSYVPTGAYFGVAAMLLALVAGWRLRARPVATALSAMAAVGLMAAFGIPPVSLILEHLPPWSGGLNYRVLHVPALAGALGAGAAVGLLERRPLALRHAAALTGALGAAVLAFVLLERGTDLVSFQGWQTGAALLHFGLFAVLGLACLAALGRAPRRAAVALVLVVAVADLAYLRDINVILPPDKAYPADPPSLRYLAAQPGEFRVSAVQPRPGTPVLPPNTSALAGLDDVGGYDYPQPKRWSDFATFVLRVQSVKRELPITSAVAQGPGLTGLRMMNTRFHLAPPGARSPDPSFERVYTGADGVVFRDPRALPRAYVVPAVRRADDGAALVSLAKGELDPRREALVPTDAARAPGGGGALPEARVERPAPDHVRVTLPPGASGWLVLADAYWPQWSAEVDGEAREVEPTNLVAMGLPVATGERQVDFRLDRTAPYAGAAISAAALLACLFLLAWPGRRRGVAGSG